MFVFESIGPWVVMYLRTVLPITYGAFVHQRVEELEKGMKKLRKELEDEKVRKTTY